VVVLTDIGNEPDDSQSLVRFLAYANEFQVEGLVATTSTWQRDHVQPKLIQERIGAYEAVRPRLLRHAPGYPTAAALRQVVRSGVPLYGMKGVGAGRDTAASNLIVEAVDGGDRRALWVLAWGGVADLAQALWSVRATRSSEQLRSFLSKLRVYSISDQDDAGPWIRQHFPQLFWISSIHGWGQYNAATWFGISGDRRSGERWPEKNMVLDPWLEANVRRGPLGALYPLPIYIMEGDTPSFLYLLRNGLGDPEHPDYGSWGGRYARAAETGGLHADTKDVLVREGVSWVSNQASVFRWRRAFQNDFAARIGWTLTDDRSKANHPPQVVLQGITGTAPVHVRARAGDTIRVSARGTRDPDGQPLAVSWWQYREAGGFPPQPALTITSDGLENAQLLVPKLDAARSLHVILEVQDGGTPPLTRYRRLIVDATPD
jgi:hypothetical protein